MLTYIQHIWAYYFVFKVQIVLSLACGTLFTLTSDIILLV